MRVLSGELPCVLCSHGCRVVTKEEWRVKSAVLTCDFSPVKFSLLEDGPFLIYFHCLAFSLGLGEFRGFPKLFTGKTVASPQ